MKKTIRLTSLLLISIIWGCSNGSMSSGKLDGTWIPIKQEMNGTLLPNSAFENQRLTLKDSMYTVIAESTDKGVARYTDSKMDIYGKEGVNAGKHFMASYRLENNLLTVCYNLQGDSYPVNFETKGKPFVFLAVFKKVELK